MCEVPSPWKLAAGSELLFTSRQMKHMLAIWVLPSPPCFLDGSEIVNGRTGTRTVMFFADTAHLRPPSLLAFHFCGQARKSLKVKESLPSF